MFDEIIKSMQARGRAKSRKITKDMKTEDILSTFNAHNSLPLSNVFTKGELVTQVITHIDKGDGEPLRRYAFPIPGQPARVVAMLANPGFTAEDTGSGAGYNDLLIEAAVPCSNENPTPEVREYRVSSRYFRPWIEGETIPPELADFIDKQAAETESKED
jgi:hypothetical protein